jgi:hypothetical protein
MATKARKSARKKTTRSAKKSTARKPKMRSAAKRKSPKRAAPAKRSRLAGVAKRLPVARVKRVTREVVEQATGAVSAGMDTLKDFGENLVNRVRQ